MNVKSFRFVGSILRAPAVTTVEIADVLERVAGAVVVIVASKVVGGGVVADPFVGLG